MKPILLFLDDHFDSAPFIVLNALLPELKARAYEIFADENPHFYKLDDMLEIIEFMLKLYDMAGSTDLDMQLRKTSAQAQQAFLTSLRKMQGKYSCIDSAVNDSFIQTQFEPSEPALEDDTIWEEYRSRVMVYRLLHLAREDKGVIARVGVMHFKSIQKYFISILGEELARKLLISFHIFSPIFSAEKAMTKKTILECHQIDLGESSPPKLAIHVLKLLDERSQSIEGPLPSRFDAEYERLIELDNLAGQFKVDWKLLPRVTDDETTRKLLEKAKKEPFFDGEKARLYAAKKALFRKNQEQLFPEKKRKEEINIKLNSTTSVLHSEPYSDILNRTLEKAKVGVAEYRKHEYNSAINILKECLKTLLSLLEHPITQHDEIKKVGLELNIATASWNISSCLNALGKIEEAEPYLNEAFAIRKKHLGEEAELTKSTGKRLLESQEKASRTQYKR